MHVCIHGVVYLPGLEHVEQATVNNNNKNSFSDTLKFFFCSEKKKKKCDRFSIVKTQKHNLHTDSAGSEKRGQRKIDLA